MLYNKYLLTELFLLFEALFHSIKQFLKMYKTTQDWTCNIFSNPTVYINAPVNILPARGGGGHTRGFRQKTIPDRREFDKLMESGSRVI